MENNQYADVAVDLFVQGYNCAQSVYAAFCPVTGLSREQALRLASPFGGGFGRMREVCGAFSGATMVMGHLFGYSSLEDPAKDRLYPRVQELGKRFREKAGSLVCRDILKDMAEVGGTASPRTERFYAERPCARMVEIAAEVLTEYLKEEGIL